MSHAEERPSKLAVACAGLFAVNLFLVPFVKIGEVPLGGSAMQLADFLFVPVALLWLVGWWRKDFRLTLGPALWALVAYAVVASISGAVVAPDRKAWLVHFAAFGYLAALCTVTASVAATPLGRRLVVWGWSAGAAATAALGLLSVVMFYLGFRDRETNVFLWVYGSIPVGNYPRVSIFFNNANMLCSYLLVSLGVMAVAWSDSSSVRHRRFLAAAMIATAVVLLFTLSSGIGGAMLSAALAWWLWKRRRNEVKPLREAAVLSAGALGAVGFFALSVVLLVPPGQGDVRLGIADLQLARSGRMDNWRSAWDHFEAAPVSGIGLGVLPSVVVNPRALHSMEHWGTERMKDTRPRRMEAHNIWLSVLAQLGLPGFAAFVIFLWMVLRRLLPDREVSDSEALARIALWVTLIGAVFYHGLFGSFEESRQYWFLFGLVFAVKAVASRASVRALSPQALSSGPSGLAQKAS